MLLKAVYAALKILNIIWTAMLHIGALIFWFILILSSYRWHTNAQPEAIKIFPLANGYYAAETKESGYLELRSKKGNTEASGIETVCAEGDYIHGKMSEDRYFIFSTETKELYKSPYFPFDKKRKLTEYLLILEDNDLHQCVSENSINISASAKEKH